MSGNGKTVSNTPSKEDLRRAYVWQRILGTVFCGAMSACLLVVLVKEVRALKTLESASREFSLCPKPDRACLGCGKRAATRLSDTFDLTREEYQGNRWVSFDAGLGASWLCDTCENPGINNRAGWVIESFTESHTQWLPPSDTATIHTGPGIETADVHRPLPRLLFYAKSPATLAEEKRQHQRGASRIAVFAGSLFVAGLLGGVVYLNVVLPREYKTGQAGA